MTNASSILSTILSTFDGATLCRTKGQTFIALRGEVVDGVQTYIKVAVSNLLSKDTTTCKAFDLESAKAEYAEFAKAQEAKANAPKATKAVNTEAVAKRAEQDKALTEFFANEAEEGHAYTATELCGLVNGFGSVMEVGQTTKRLADNGIFTIVMDGTKKTYIKA